MFKHGDDFILSGKRSNVQELTTKLMEHIALKDKGRLGWRPELGDLAEAKILNRIIRVSRTTDGTPFAEVESDPRHVEIICEAAATAGCQQGSQYTRRARRQRNARSHADFSERVDTVQVTRDAC